MVKLSISELKARVQEASAARLPYPVVVLKRQEVRVWVKAIEKMATDMASDGDGLTKLDILKFYGLEE